MSPGSADILPIIWSVCSRRRQGKAFILLSFRDRYEGFIREDTVMLEITYEDPSITAGDHCLYDICITVEPDDPRLVLQKTAAVAYCT